MSSKRIVIRGARQHNLKQINLDLPKHRLIVITGLSGSGKSSLAFDTLYAEGQRRYVESLSVYARQFLERMQKPDVDHIDGLSPAIAIEQKSASHNPRSTVGTVTEIYDYLRLLYARVGAAHCHRCGAPIVAQAQDQILSEVMGQPEGTRLILYAPVVSAEMGKHRELLRRMRKDGFARVRIDGETHLLEAAPALSQDQRHDIDVVIDRLIVKANIRNRLADSLELALALANGRAVIEFLAAGRSAVAKQLHFSETPECTQCGIQSTSLEPANFSFNSPHGACPHCDGLGTTSEIDPGLLVPNQRLSLREGAVDIWSHRNSVAFMNFLEAFTRHYKTDIFTPFEQLPDAFKTALMNGSGAVQIPFFTEKEQGRHIQPRPYEGLIPQLQRRYQETDSPHVREEIRRYMAHSPCRHCQGSRLRPESRSVRVGGISIQAMTSFTAAEALAFVKALGLEGKAAAISERILREIIARLSFLLDVGLGYLSLDRPAHTLSGGESQRIRLATQIGSKLTGVLYVLDEPSIGLHQKDNQRLLRTLTSMRDLGNTVLVVEHDEEAIRQADYVVDMGPGAGMQGGEVVFAGDPAALLEDPHSLTGKYLSGRKRISRPKVRREGNGKQLSIRGARLHNLKQIDVDLPLGCMIVVSGVSGSGKSSLIIETLYKGIRQRLHGARERAGVVDRLDGWQQIDKVIHIDQGPIGRTPRSNAGTYTGLFSFIREIFSRTPEARMRGYKPGRFSFNTKGGRCEACAGDGIVKIEMHFLPDVYVPCDVCKGKRYNRETLEIRYKGKNIADVLDMTVDQALAFFRRLANIRTKLETLADVGLGYIHLGQAATTLSGGEAQRIKLAKELSRKSTGNTLYVLDEPTTGLHLEDVSQLLHVLNRLVDAGNSVIIIEHHLEVIKCADHVIDLGPEGGEGGGKIVAQGPPEAIAAAPRSHTGRFLGKLLNG
ncbi:MAG: excinuclease ABC subunit UvrA [Desulfosarcinaceae bacterium]|nr:excinuclease ABC subunit UvrA [Desulfosarcinaceae bacterium]